MTRAYIGIGSNLEQPIAQVQAGVEALRQLPESAIVRCSSLYRTAPVGVAPQPAFINAVCEIETELPPERLMHELLGIERDHGRTRGPAPGMPRTLDLDLLLYDDVTLESAALTVPHPRLHERAFVLYPLCEIAPALSVPGRGGVAELLRRCEGQSVERLSS
jgi:2-amino-4-hydroxy-6-hydroxymethyldihydropteridine diphosphokinase